MKVYYLMVSAFCLWTPAHSQFFYSHYTPLQAPFFPQNFLPLPAAAPLAYTPNAASSVTYNIPAAPTAEFRGFGYRTDYRDGATSTVFYVTGPEAQNLGNFRDFPNFSRKVQEPAKARSLASDIIDVNAVPNAEGKIQSVLQPSDFQKLFDSITPGVVNFYTFPASTVPLEFARQLNVTENDNVTTTTPATDEKVAAESVVNPKILINEIDSIIKNNDTSESTTEAHVNTTEASDKKENSTDETPEKTTLYINVETTTFETATEV